MFEPDSHLEDTTLAPAERAAAAARTTWASVAVNLGLAGTQIAVGLLSKSQGLVADGVHSLSDLVADFVVLFAGHHSKKDPDADHPYGHQRFETAASLVLGALLLAVGAGMLWAAVRKLQDPDGLQRVHGAALWVAAAALVAKEALFRYMLKTAERVKSSMLVANAWHARSDAASSLVVGLGILGNLNGFPILDPIAALIVGFMICKMGWGFAWAALGDLVDRAVDETEVAAILRTLTETPGVHAVHDLRTRKMGDMVIVDAHLEVDASMTVEAGHDIAVLARQRVMQHHRVLDLMTHIDPWRKPDLDHAVPAGAGARARSRAGRSTSGLGVDAGDLRALDAQADHQALLVEDERIGVVLQRRGGQVAGHAGIDRDHRRADADLPSAGAVQVLHRVVVHQKDDISVGFRTGLPAPGSGHRVVVAVHACTLHQHALAVAATEHQSGLEDLRKHQDGPGTLAQRVGCGIGLVQCLQRLGCLGVELLGGDRGTRGARCARQRHGHRARGRGPAAQGRPRAAAPGLRPRGDGVRRDVQ
jgi:cation diffusion facilitator family transporter